MKTWTKTEILELIKNNNKMVVRCIKVLYAQQTEAEQESKTTINRNGAGLNAYDASFVTSCVLFYNSHGFLTPRQLEACRKKMYKYGGQLAALANAGIKA